MKDKFIVAEITKNWECITPVNELLSQKFESVINLNYQRGYKLVDWKISTTRDETVLTETIIAIFQLIGPPQLTNFIEKFISRHEAGLLPDRFLYEEGVDVLKSYNDGK